MAASNYRRGDYMSDNLKDYDVSRSVEAHADIKHLLPGPNSKKIKGPGKRVLNDSVGRVTTPKGDTYKLRYIVTTDNKFELVEKVNIQDNIQSAYKMSDSDVYSILDAVATGTRILEPGGDYFDTSDVPTNIYDARSEVDRLALQLNESLIAQENNNAPVVANKTTEKEEPNEN